MQIYKGNGVSSGIAMGRLHFYYNEKKVVERKENPNFSEELLRLQVAVSVAKEELRTLYESAKRLGGQESADIFLAYEMILEDEVYLHSISSEIEGQKVKAEYAVQLATKQMADKLKLIEDEMVQEKVSDIEDVSERLCAILANRKQMLPKCEEPVILVADELLPSEMIQIDRDWVAGIVLKGGNGYSHTVVLARNMGIPMIVGMTCTPDESKEKVNAVLDGSKGKLYLEPNSNEIQKLFSVQLQEQSIMLTGHDMDIYANMNGPKDLETVLKSGACGVGLFRTEFEYLKRDECPTEEELFQVYREIAQRMGGKKVVIRTADLGGDKTPAYLTYGVEKNIKIEYRGIRISLMLTELFTEQLRAVLRASAYGKVAILFPFVTSVEELKQAKVLLQRTKEALRAEGVAFDDTVEIGAMIETPEAALVVRKLAKEADFIGIGTNDLTQHISDENQRDESYPTVIQTIQMVVEGAHAEEKQVCICGEMASDLNLTETFSKMGVDALSVAPHMVPLLEKG